MRSVATRSDAIRGEQMDGDFVPRCSICGHLIVAGDYGWISDLFPEDGWMHVACPPSLDVLLDTCPDD